MLGYNTNGGGIGTTNQMGYEYPVYSTNNVDYNVLLKLGFNGKEVDFTNQVAAQFGKVTTDRVTKITGNPILAKKISYLYNVICGRDSNNVIQCVNTLRRNNMTGSPDDGEFIASMENLADHYKKMHQVFNGGVKQVYNKTLPRPNIGLVPKKAIVGGITDEIFCIYNSNIQLVKERLYDVVGINDVNTMLRTTKTPVLVRGQEPKVAGVGEIREDTKRIGKNSQDRKTYLVVLNNRYVRICNRYIIAASTQRPNIHCGLCEIICRDGTILYIYAVELTGGDKVNGGIDKVTGEADKYKENSSTRVVYDYGYRACDIEQKILKVTQLLYGVVKGILYVKIKPQHKFIEGIRKQVVEQPQEDCGDVGNKY